MPWCLVSLVSSPRFPPPYLLHGQGRLPPASTTRSALADTLRQFVDFDLLNAGKVRASFGVVNVRTGNFAYFDSRKDRLGPEHVMASGALPPGFPSVEIDGEHYWDGAWCQHPAGPGGGRGEHARHAGLPGGPVAGARWPPTSLEEVAERQKDIQYSSRTRLVTDQLRRVLAAPRPAEAAGAPARIRARRGRPGRAAPAVTRRRPTSST